MQKVNLYSSSLNDLLCNGIVRKYQFKSPGRYHYDKLDAYLVDSEIYRSITYGIDHRDFFILDNRGFIVCPIKDIDCLLKTLVKPVRNELEDILQDIKDLRRMNIEYQKPVSSNCPERSATCHATCKRYKDFEIENALDREEKHRQKQDYMRANDVQIAGMKRMQRGKRK